MSSFALYLMACLMFAGPVFCGRMIPAQVSHPDALCVARGFLGSCSNLSTPRNSAYVDCSNIECAAPLRGKANTHRAMSIGTAPVGTICDVEKVCWHGQCIELPRGSHMPTETGEHDEGYVCYRPGSGQNAGTNCRLPGH